MNVGLVNMSENQTCVRCVMAYFKTEVEIRSFLDFPMLQSNWCTKLPKDQ